MHREKKRFCVKLFLEARHYLLETLLRFYILRGKMKTVTNKAIINYLLGENASHLSGDEFLAECFSSDENAEKFERVRDDLIESFLRGNLSKEDEKRFENHFLSDPQNRDLVEFSKDLRAHLLANKQQLEAAAGGKTEKKSFSPGSLLIPAGALAGLLLVSFLAWQFVVNYTGNQISEVKPTPVPSIALQISPTASTQPTIEPAPEISSAPTVKPTETPKINPPAAPPNAPESVVMTFVLPLIGKGNDAEKVLKINRQTKQVNLQTAKPFKEFPSYQVKVQKDGEPPFFDKNFEKFPTVGNGQIIVNVPAENFNNGKHRFIIFGVNPDGTTEELKGTERFFTVERQK
jgi:hypothetical protein